ncbi:MAG: hypothetical protein JWO45_1493 [Spartobacteria bacterium]|nr:hypothetical protein [Spartobacteria bacterium]
MNDFSDLENKLKALQPASPSADLLSRLEKAMTEEKGETPSDYKIVRPDRFQINWAFGLGLAAAAVLLLVVRVNFRPPHDTSRLAAISPAPTIASVAPALRNAFIPSGATQVVYHTRDEGLLFPGLAEEPVRRVRSRTRETLQWHNPATGASLRVSYLSEQVQLIPVSGQ